MVIAFFWLKLSIPFSIFVTYSINKAYTLELIKETIAKRISAELKNKNNIIIFTHRNPDGDALGAALGLYHFLKMQKKDVRVISPNAYPEFLHWLPGDEEIIQFNKQKTFAKDIISGAEIIFHLDFNALSRIGELEKLVLNNKESVKILIDHHPDPEPFADIEISETSVSSTAELVYYLIRLLDRKSLKNKDICTCLFTGIMTDTGCFSFNSSLPSTWEVVADLLRSGINKDRIFDRVYNNFSAPRMKLLGFSLDQKMTVLPEYHTAYISLSREEMKMYDFQTGDSEGFVNYPLSIKGILFSVLFLEKEKYVKLSLRSRGEFPVNDFARRYFNGGGHRNAAGGECKLSLQETLTRFEQLLPDFVSKFK